MRTQHFLNTFLNAPFLPASVTSLTSTDEDPNFQRQFPPVFEDLSCVRSGQCSVCSRAQGAAEGTCRCQALGEESCLGQLEKNTDLTREK